MSTTPLVLLGARLLGAPRTVDVLLRDGRIQAVGPDLARTAGSGVEQVDAGGRTVLPGLWDAHTHMTQWALARQRLDVSAATSAAHAVRIVLDRLAAGPLTPGTALVGYGFRDGLWPDEPTAALLDAAVGDTPVILVSGDLHCAWFSTAGLRYAGVAAHPTGLLRETEWLPLASVVDHVPDDLADRWVAEAAQAAAARGVVGVVELEITENLGPWRRRIAAGTDTLRVRAGVWESYLDKVLAEDLRSGDVVVGTGGLLEQGPLKVVTDGSLNTRTAFCHDPYPDLTGDDRFGILSVPPEHLVPLMAHAHRKGLTCAIHAIGDHANTLALDAFAASGATGSVEHAQLLVAEDVARFVELGVTASVQPEHAMDDRDVADRHWAGRTDRAFALASLAAAGVRLAMGSDAPVAPLDPWQAVAAAVERTRDGREPWHPEQRLDLLTALRSSTDGQPLELAVGAPADLVLLDADPLVAGTPLREMPVAATLLGGRWTHRTF
ncbi:amidohydrolase [Cellulomonas triticagri]|uniref:Amidohydrolase n=1 Tax=Cellulomonas triticagri TaxID=2483352 RepID=A0A3M2JNR9_9CELL|nr:amidohydrolase [Cellulomonas triticagri]RMI13961.1 amidohydrolase [Cellulomonas triticagri]